MDQRLKMRISRLFRGSCRTGNLSDVAQNPVFVPQQKEYYFQMMEPLPPPPPRPFPSICKPNCPDTTAKAIANSIFPRQKISSRYPPFLSANFSNGRTCPPASPASPFTINPFYSETKNNCRNKKKKKKKKKNFSNINNNNTSHVKFNNNFRRDMSLFSSSSQDSAYFEGSYWFSSEEESDTLFSSRSLSSDSSGYHQHNHRHHNHCSRRNKYSSSRRRKSAVSSSSSSTKGVTSCEIDVLPLHGKVKDSFAVVKSSSDPYNDFRTSMVEMIVEKQIFSAKDLEQLLQCFLSLNSDHLHKIILEVFTEIWEALFSNWS